MICRNAFELGHQQTAELCNRIQRVGYQQSYIYKTMCMGITWTTEKVKKDKAADSGCLRTHTIMAHSQAYFLAFEQSNMVIYIWQHSFIYSWWYKRPNYNITYHWSSAKAGWCCQYACVAQRKTPDYIDCSRSGRYWVSGHLYSNICTRPKQHRWDAVIVPCDWQP